jgi:hypothetical protein
MRILLQEPERAISMGKSAREHVEQCFSRHVFGENLNRIAISLSSVR